MQEQPKPSVAVCLAAFNGLRYLPQQVDSILEQQGVDVTVYISVDASTDGTERWCAELAQREPRVRLLPLGARFGGAAANFFRLVRDVDFARHDYAAYCDQDDVWLPEKLQRAVHCLRSEEWDGYSSDVCAFWSDGRKRYIKKSYPQQPWDYLFESAGPGCTFVLSQRLILDLQAFARTHQTELAEVALHDWFTYAYARAHGYRWGMDAQATLMYRQHQHNEVGVNAGWRAWLWRLRRVWGGWWLNQAQLIARLAGVDHDPFVQAWSAFDRKGLWNLAMQARLCRRRPRDQWTMAVLCLLLMARGKKP